jgi:hypothetical protein
MNASDTAICRHDVQDMTIRETHNAAACALQRQLWAVTEFRPATTQ